MFRYSVIVVSGSLPVQAFVWGGGIFNPRTNEKILLFHLDYTPLLTKLPMYTGAAIKLLSAIEKQHNRLFHLHPFLVL